jgi:hypothetical protein
MQSRGVVARIGFAALTVMVSSLVGVPVASGAEPPAFCHPTWQRQDPNITTQGVLLSVSATSEKDVWALGNTQSDGSIIDHWDGTRWTKMDVPVAGAGECDPLRHLSEITAISPRNVWAVGYVCDGAGHRPWVLHYNGHAWDEVDVPTQGPDAHFLGVDADGPNDIWAVGHYNTMGGDHLSFTEHWDGVSWSIVPSPNPSASNNFLDGVLVLGPNDAWATGRAGSDHALTMHWDGTAWSSEPVESGELSAVDASSGSGVWAAGVSLRLGMAVSAHWNGASWNPVNTADLGTGVRSAFYGLRTDPLGTWGVGRINVGDVQQPLVEHVQGAGWAVIPSLAVDAPALFEGMTSVNGHIWAVGFEGPTLPLIEHLCQMQVLDGGFSASGSSSASVGLGSSAMWVLPTDDSAQHSVTDNSGMGLFDSGLMDPGSSSSYAFVAAGTYPIVDSSTGHTGSIPVAIKRAPASGHRSTEFKITWAVAAPTGFVFDVAIKRPGSSAYVSWKSGVRTMSAPFIPDRGVGTYWFKSRLRKVAAASQTTYSPPVGIKVT